MSSYRSYELLNTYATFCSFGAGGKNGSSSEGLNSSDSQMDNARFAKLAKDCGMIDKNITTIEIDIVFNKFKTKGARKLDFHTFNTCIRYLAEKKYSAMNGDKAYEAIVDLICKKSSAPVLNGTLPFTPGVFDKLTDSSQYTGASKQRFDEDGNGRGLEGRKDVSKAPVNKGLVSKPAAKASTEKLAKGSVEKITKSTEKLAVFDRLTNTAGYTGASKQRFDAEGNGKGLAGRDSPSKTGNAGAYRGGDVKDLSQILRS